MRKLILYVSLFWILLPLQSKAIIPEISEFANAKCEVIKELWKKFNDPSAETQSLFEILNDKFDKIHRENWDNPKSEYTVSPDDTKTILHIIDGIRSKDINKPIGYYDNTFLKICITETSHYPEADAEKITKKLLEKGADIAYNPQARSYSYYVNHEAPLWSAALSGNVGAYNEIIDHAQDTHLSRPYGDKVLKLPHVINYALERLKTMESHYKSELQKIKNGERKGHTYKYFNQFGRGYYGLYGEHIVIKNLLRVAWLKNRFQKIQKIHTQYSENKYSSTSPSATTPEEEFLIEKFLEEHIETFDEYIQGAIYESYEAGITDSHINKSK